MDVREAIKSQYYAALEMLRQAVVACPASRWDELQARKRFWHVAYHTLFYTHLYLQDTVDDFRPWSQHREHYQFRGTLPWPPHERPTIGEPYGREQILEYLEFCQKQAIDKVASVDLEAPSGFPWLPFGKLELQIYNIRHVQHHVAELIEWLGANEGLKVDWVGMSPHAHH